jgi:hypothetical protein
MDDRRKPFIGYGPPLGDKHLLISRVQRGEVF